MGDGSKFVIVSAVTLTQRSLILASGGCFRAFWGAGSAFRGGGLAAAWDLPVVLGNCANVRADWRVPLRLALCLPMVVSVEVVLVEVLVVSESVSVVSVEEISRRDGAFGHGRLVGSKKERKRVELANTVTKNRDSLCCDFADYEKNE